MKVVEVVKLLSPYRKNWVIWELVFSKMLELIFLILLRISFLKERNITTSLLIIHLKCTVVHYANLNSSFTNKPFLNYGPMTMLFRFFRFLIYVFFNETCKKIYEITIIFNIFWKHIFTRVIIKSKIFHSCRTHDVRVALVSHSCRTRVARVSLVSHSCCSCRTRVVFLSLVSATCVVN